MLSRPLAHGAIVSRLSSNSSDVHTSSKLAKKTTYGPLTILFVGALSLWSPIALLVVASALMSLWAAICLYRVYFSLCSYKDTSDMVRLHQAARPKRLPFVSIHVPIHNEPPQLVIQTLRSLQHLNYPRFEVLVLDNNTKDELLWKPVERFCRSEGKPFRFFHYERLAGFKAGALNKCISLAHPSTELIFVVDSDYWVEPAALIDSVGAFEDPKVGFLQFPQAYRSKSTMDADLLENYTRYFDRYMNYADHYGVPLLTGTLSLVRKQALCDIGGWSTASITEDASTGLEILKSGYRGRFCAEEIGGGIHPANFNDLRRQRARWAQGNTKTLAQLTWQDIRKLGIAKASCIAMQLTAWVQPHGLLLMLLGVAIASSAIGQEGARAAVLVCLIYLVLAFLCLGFEHLTHQFIFKRSHSGLIHALKLTWVESYAPMAVLLAPDKNQTFITTPKYVCDPDHLRSRKGHRSASNL